VTYGNKPGEAVKVRYREMKPYIKGGILCFSSPVQRRCFVKRYPIKGSSVVLTRTAKKVVLTGTTSVVLRRTAKKVVLTGKKLF
jgi:hypothetical protein